MACRRDEGRAAAGGLQGRRRRAEEAARVHSASEAGENSEEDEDVSEENDESEEVGDPEWELSSSITLSSPMDANLIRNFLFMMRPSYIAIMSNRKHDCKKKHAVIFLPPLSFMIQKPNLVLLMEMMI